MLMHADLFAGMLILGSPGCQGSPSWSIVFRCYKTVEVYLPPADAVAKSSGCCATTGSEPAKTSYLNRASNLVNRLRWSMGQLSGFLHAKAGVW